MNDYIETEVKIPNINPDELIKALEKLGALKVFDDDRNYITLDFEDKRLTKKGEEIRLTEEGKLKLSFDRRLDTGRKETIKVFVSRKEEMLAFLNRIGINPIAEVKSHRISFEWKGVDFDLDVFPKIPPFLEIDVGGTDVSLNEVIEKLGLQGKEIVTLSTKEIYKANGLDYFELFKTNS